jgi:hypothetical protein
VDRVKLSLHVYKYQVDLSRSYLLEVGNSLRDMLYCYLFRKMLDLQYQHNKCTTTFYMRVDLTHWNPPSCKGLLYTCCDGVVHESNHFKKYFTISQECNTKFRKKILKSSIYRII